MDNGVDIRAGAGPVTLAGFRLYAYDALPSTNDAAKDLIRAGAEMPLVVWARQQTAGRGRLDRHWVSPPGNLYASFGIRPLVPIARAAELGFVASLAAADAIAGTLGHRPSVQVKWPNDVLLDGAKVCGILLECETRSGGALDWLVVGIGINVATAPADTPYPATAIDAVAGGGTDVATVLDRLASCLSDRLTLWQSEGFGAIRRDWLARAARLGETIALVQSGRRRVGRFRDIDPDGALLLETATGMDRIAAGDVYFPTLGSL